MDRAIYPEKELLSAEEVASQMGVSVDTFRGLVERHEFPAAIRISRQKEKWHRMDVVAWSHLRSRGMEFCRIQTETGGNRGKSEVS